MTVSIQLLKVYLLYEVEHHVFLQIDVVKNVIPKTWLKLDDEVEIAGQEKQLSLCIGEASP